jgi:hypothetical protein
VRASQALLTRIRGRAADLVSNRVGPPGYTVPREDHLADMLPPQDPSIPMGADTGDLYAPDSQGVRYVVNDTTVSLPPMPDVVVRPTIMVTPPDVTITPTLSPTLSVNNTLFLPEDDRLSGVMSAISEVPSLLRGIMSAIQDIRDAGPPTHRVSVEAPDVIVTPSVTIPERLKRAVRVTHSDGSVSVVEEV